MAHPVERLGIFPLPHVVLFPHAQLPLHIFEPRYRALVRSALAASGRLVMAVLKPGSEEHDLGHPALYTTGCVGRIVQHELLPDGCSDLILEGEAAAEIEEVPSEAPFRVARVRTQATDRAFVEGAGASERIEELHTLLDRACPGCVAALAERMPAGSAADGGLQLLHTIATHLPVGVARKIEWLRRPGTLARWHAIREELKRLGAERGRRASTLARYADCQPSDPVRN